MSPSQKLNQILESLKKNSERADLKIWIIQTIEEDTEFDRTEAECVTKLLNKMKSSLKFPPGRKQGKSGKKLSISSKKKVNYQRNILRDST